MKIQIWNKQTFEKKENLKDRAFFFPSPDCLKCLSSSIEMVFQFTITTIIIVAHTDSKLEKQIFEYCSNARVQDLDHCAI